MGYALLTHPKLTKEAHQHPKTTSQAVVPPSGASLPGGFEAPFSSSEGTGSVCAGGMSSRLSVVPDGEVRGVAMTDVWCVADA